MTPLFIIGLYEEKLKSLSTVQINCHRSKVSLGTVSYIDRSYKRHDMNSVHVSAPLVHASSVFGAVVALQQVAVSVNVPTTRGWRWLGPKCETADRVPVSKSVM